MRNGNIEIDKISDTSSMFLPYLWGMETVSKATVLKLLIHSSYRTYEEWKHFLKNIIFYRWFPFLPYLWGMETTIFEIRIKGVDSVLTVPMRNGNVVDIVEQMDAHNSSYRTYEEWKLVKNLQYAKQSLVLTVPMRNGNCLRLLVFHRSTWFLPYLWGMETSIRSVANRFGTLSSYRTYEEWKHVRNCL